MKLFRKIDTTTGNFIEDVIFKSHPTVLDAEGNAQLDPQYVEEAPQQGLYLPKWTGTEWVEGGEPLPIPDPIPSEPTVDERLNSLEEVMLFLI